VPGVPASDVDNAVVLLGTDVKHFQAWLLLAAKWVMALTEV